MYKWKNTLLYCINDKDLITFEEKGIKGERLKIRIIDKNKFRHIIKDGGE